MSDVILEAIGLAKTYKEGSLITPVFDKLNLAVKRSAGRSPLIASAAATLADSLVRDLATRRPSATIS